MKRLIVMLLSICLFLVISPQARSLPVSETVKKETVLKDAVNPVAVNAAVITSIPDVTINAAGNEQRCFSYSREMVILTKIPQTVSTPWHPDISRCNNQVGYAQLKTPPVVPETFIVKHYCLV